MLKIDGVCSRCYAPLRLASSDEDTDSYLRVERELLDEIAQYLQRDQWLFWEIWGWMGKYAALREAKKENQL